MPPIDWKHWLEALGPGVVALIGILGVQVNAARQFKKAEARLREQFEKADARTAEAQRIQREIAEKADQRAAEAQRVQREIAEKPLLVEKHKEAYLRCRLIWVFDANKQTGEGWEKFMRSMDDWAAENRLYLSPRAYAAFKDALDQRLVIDAIGDDAVLAHERVELLKKLADDLDLIVEHSPRY
jgi:hypothetical protein